MANKPTWPPLHGKPLIQRRVSIARPPAPPTEDSDVLVLNSRSTLPDPSIVGAEVLYLDLRLSFPSTQPTHGNWAFAGARETVQLNEEVENAVRYHWKHAIDSHGSGEPPDKGTMVKQKDENGEQVEVETGVGINPETGGLGPYEEVWKEEYVPVGAPFAFLMSNENPSQSTSFMAVLGPHAMGFWQSATAVEGRLAITHGDDGRHFHAVRLRSNAENCWDEGDVYSKIFSTGYQILDDQLEKLVDELLERERKGKQLWKRGERLVLKGERNKDMTWTVWDAGHVTD